ncbi:hypothetical protein NDU88_004856 [Pleurodeles waltl]|uniref:Uncharacterized protein n=1 Tax=Pleurodeles waltl TaxID=8319 RepID=A0AAV7SK45_PLEWA|nr:hypothetical protein NDU88_004856 [Pleurodeles waltl]
MLCVARRRHIPLQIKDRHQRIQHLGEYTMGRLQGKQQNPELTKRLPPSNPQKRLMIDMQRYMESLNRRDLAKKAALPGCENVGPSPAA